MLVATFSSCFLLPRLLLLLLLLLRLQTATPKIEPLPAANHHGSEGRKSIKIAPKNCLMYNFFKLLFPPVSSCCCCSCYSSETQRKKHCSYFFLLFPAAAAAPAPATPVAAATPKIEPLPAANPHGSEGRKSIKIAPKNCLM